MKLLFSKELKILASLLFLVNNYAYAETGTALPTSTQVNKSTQKVAEKIEIVDEIVIKTQSGKENNNSALKQGEACDDEQLEVAVLGPDFQEIPMAKTEPCSTVDCKDLKPAKLLKDSYRKVQMAKTTPVKPCVKK